MTELFWRVTTFLADKKEINTLLFGTLEDDCHGTVLMKVIIIVINFLMSGILLMGTIGIIVSGLQVLAARDDAGMVARAKQRIIDIAIGIATFVLMFIIINFIVPGGVTLNSDALNSDGTDCPEVKPITTGGDPTDPENPEDPENPPSSGDIEHGTRKFVMCGVTYDVVKVQVNGVKDDGTDSTGLKKFLTDKIQKYHINQSDGKLYDLNGNHSNSSAQDGHCDIVSRNMAYDMYFDTLTSDSCSTGSYDRSAGFETVQGDSGFSRTYDYIMKGIPVAHRVTINDGPGGHVSRHYAVIVGIKQGANRQGLTTGDLLFLETWGDGVLWVNTPGVLGGYRTNAGGSGCTKVTNKNRFPYDTYFYAPQSKTGDDKKDCGT